MKFKSFFLLGCVAIVAVILRVILDPIKGGLPLLIFVLVCASVTALMLVQSIWTELKQKNWVKVVIVFFVRDWKASIAILAILVFIVLLENALTAWILKLMTQQAILVYVTEIVCLITAFSFWPTRSQIPKTE